MLPISLGRSPFLLCNLGLHPSAPQTNPARLSGANIQCIWGFGCFWSLFGIYFLLSLWYIKLCRFLNHSEPICKGCSCSARNFSACNYVGSKAAKVETRTNKRSWKWRISDKSPTIPYIFALHILPTWPYMFHPCHLWSDKAQAMPRPVANGYALESWNSCARAPGLQLGLENTLRDLRIGSSPTFIGYRIQTT